MANPVDLPAALIGKMQQLTSKEKEMLPNRLSLFGMSLLPPEYYKVFSRLAEVIDVSLYLQVPKGITHVAYIQGPVAGQVSFAPLENS
jgi:hypothetical protein